MMRYAALDVETTGLNPDTCQVIEIGCVVETDWKTPVEYLPTFRALVWHDEIRGEPQALAMNAGLLAEYAENPGLYADLCGNIIDLGGFLELHFGTDSVTFAGKNLGKFDYQFLRKSPQWERCIHHKHRFIDVGNLWWDPSKDDFLPDMFACKQRAGLTPNVAHRAVDDCRSVITCVRARFMKGAA